MINNILKDNQKIEKEKNKFSFKKILLIVLIILFIIFVITTIINIVNAKIGKTPIFYFAKTINSVDSSVIYKIFPYKITEYKNIINSDSYVEVSLFFKKYINQFYNPKSSKYIYKTSEYKPPVIDINKHIALIDDVIQKVNIDGFSLGTNSNYSIIYIDTFLNNENRIKLIEGINKEIGSKLNNKTVIFKSLDSLKNDNIYINQKILNGIYIKVATLENKETEDVMSMELITNVSSIFSQKVILENKIPIVFKYFDDFDQKERKRILKEEADNLAREEAFKKAEEDRKIKELEDQKKLEQLKKQAEEEFNRKQNRLRELLETSNLVIFDGKKGLIKADTYEHLLNKDKNLQDIVSYNIIKINNSKIMYFYQEQIEKNTSVNIYIKEKQLTNNEFDSLINEIKNLTGYTGIGQYQNSFVINISYLGNTKNILLLDLNNILKKYDINI